MSVRRSSSSSRQQGGEGQGTRDMVKSGSKPKPCVSDAMVKTTCIAHDVAARCCVTTHVVLARPVRLRWSCLKATEGRPRRTRLARDRFLPWKPWQCCTCQRPESSGRNTDSKRFSDFRATRKKTHNLCVKLQASTITVTYYYHYTSSF